MPIHPIDLFYQLSFYSRPEDRTVTAQQLYENAKEEWIDKTSYLLSSSLHEDDFQRMVHQFKDNIPPNLSKVEQAERMAALFLEGQLPACLSSDAKLITEYRNVLAQAYCLRSETTRAHHYRIILELAFSAIDNTDILQPHDKDLSELQDALVSCIEKQLGEHFDLESRRFIDDEKIFAVHVYNLLVRYISPSEISFIFNPQMSRPVATYLDSCFSKLNRWERKRLIEIVSTDPVSRSGHTPTIPRCLVATAKKIYVNPLVARRLFNYLKAAERKGYVDNNELSLISTPKLFLYWHLQRIVNETPSPCWEQVKQKIVDFCTCLNNPSITYERYEPFIRSSCDELIILRQVQNSPLPPSRQGVGAFSSGVFKIRRTEMSLNSPSVCHSSGIEEPKSKGP